MANYQIAWNATLRYAVVQAKGDALPSGSYVKIDEFSHGDTENADTDRTEKYLFDVNHVFFHHVRDALYREGVYDMQRVKITQDTEYKAVTGLSITPPTVTLAVNATQQITKAFTPNDASNQNVTYTTSDAAKATVSATGLITAKAAGTATITATSVDGAFTDTVVVTISA